MQHVSAYGRWPYDQMTDGCLFLVGFPNSGKTSLFNRLTGSSYKTVNYPGATTELQIGHLPQKNIQVCDTPGIHSILPHSPDERLTKAVLESPSTFIPEFSGKSVVAFVIDMVQIRRQLALFHQLRPFFPDAIILLTMPDTAKARGISISPEKLSNETGAHVFVVNGRTGDGLVHFVLHIEHLLHRHPQQHLPNSYDKTALKNAFQWSDSVFEKSGHQVNATYIDLDRFFLHPIWGWVSLFGITVFFFWAVFSLAAPLTSWTDTGMSWLIETIATRLPHTMFTTVITHGVFTSVAGVIIFVPQLIVLFVAIGLMEGTGYLARGAALVDKPLSAIGLNGRSFVPLLTGYACAIPAMLAARTIPSKRERLLTLFVIPLTSCSARLPVYGLLIAMLTPSPMIAGLLMTGVYFLSLVFASVVAAVAGKLLRLDKKQYHGFQIELPEWRIPQLKSLYKQVTDQTWGFVRRAGPLIVAVGTAVWAVSTYPTPDRSIAMYLGHIIDPLLSPIGVDWRVGVALILSFAAREVFVSALATLFSVSNTDSSTAILNTLKTATFEGTTTPIFTTSTIIGLLLFFMVSMQCAATLAVARREMGSWKLPLLMTATYILLGYGLAVLAVQLGHSFT